MANQLYILKLGGSVITDKKGNKCTVKKNRLEKIAGIISKAVAKKKFKLILVHGAGPFGHKIVTDYKIANGVKTVKQIEGLVKTRQSMETLDEAVIEALVKKNVPAFEVQASSCIIQNKKKIVSFDTKIIQKLLELGAVPVMYGDMVIDNSLGASVVSGYAIISFLAKKLKASKVLLGTDVNGIYDSNPKKNKKAKLILEINNKNINSILKKVSHSSSVDVTDGMKGKLSEIRASKAKETIIFNLEKEKNLELLLQGKKINCTIVKF
ncbi:MAG: isopentenyl phosphate kinase [archaeon]|nr:isopentenyl phosphate kinase [archaeon]